MRQRSGAGTVRLVATPPTGPAPLPVRFALVGEIPAGTVIRWEFGDGSTTNGTQLLAVEHTYAGPAAGGYTATARIGSTSSLATQIFAMPSPGHSPHPFNFFQPHFTGGGTIPADVFATLMGTNDLTQPAPFAELAMVQHTDCASFDIDRFPFTSPADRNYYADGFPGLFPTLAADYSGNFKGEDSNYRVSIFDWELAGDCGYAVDDNEFHRHPRPGSSGDCQTPRYRMVCNVGPSILPPSNAEVEPAPGDSLPPPLHDPWENRDEIAGARGWKLITGPMAAFWMEGGLR